MPGGRSIVVARALAEPVARYGLRRDDFLAIIDGMEMDAREDICAPSLVMLDIYCDRWRAPSGRLSVRAFGAEGVRARRCPPFAGTRAAAHQHPARPRRGCGARPPLFAARVPRGARHREPRAERGAGA